MQYIIRSKLSGVSFNNDDGSSRQELIKNIPKDCILTIEHELNNPFDVNSHIVKNPQGMILGHLNRPLALSLVEKVSKGEKILGIKEYNVTGGSNKQSYGVNIAIEMEKPDGDNP